MTGFLLFGVLPIAVFVAARVLIAYLGWDRDPTRKGKEKSE